MRSGRLSFKVFAGAFLLLSLHGVLPAQAQEKQTAKPKAAPLEIKLSTPAPVLCVGASLLLEMEIKNVSRKEVKVDKFDLWNRFNYSVSKSDHSGMGGGQASGCAHCRGDFIYFYPGMTYWDSYNFSLTSDFFQNVGDYTLTLSIDSINSNEVKFKLIDCGGVKPTEVTK